MIRKLLTLSLIGVAALSAAGGQGSGKPGGGGGGGGGTTPAGVVEIHTSNEKIPAGGTVQVKYLLTTPRPISGGGPKLFDYGFAVNGVAISSPQGDTAGVALSNNGMLAVEIISPNSDFGTNLDYPFLMMTMTVPQSTPAGTTFPLIMQDTEVQTPTGPVTLSTTKAGTLTTGGSVSISGVVPGGGFWSAGTLVRVQGSGFVPNTKLTTKMRTSNPVYVSPTEMTFVLSQAVNLDTQPVTAQNPDGSTTTYFSYLRGVPVSAPSRSLLRTADPIFQTQTHGFATIGPLPSLGEKQFLAIALQNPSQGPLVVSLFHERTGRLVSLPLPSGGRIMDDLSVLFTGINLQTGDVITMNATSGVQILGITGDELAVTLKPWLPSF